MSHPLYIAFVWHQHQPYYKDKLTDSYMLPWVYLHGTKDYYDMVQILDDYPAIHQTFNLVPSLLTQIEDYAYNNVHDTFLEVTGKNADTLTENERVFILKNFFMSNWETMVDVHPRYKELLVKRGRFVSERDLERTTLYFTKQDFLDLQVWFTLAWMDPYFQETDSLIQHCIAKGRGFTEEEKQLLLQKRLEILRMIIPKHKALQDKGQIEISTTPFYHPILPLLIDSTIAKTCSPEILLPQTRTNYTDDAKAQIEKAVTYYQKLFGKKPYGMWPAEGSVSDDVVPLFAHAGIRWIASDQDVLSRSAGVSHEKSALYTPYTVTRDDASISMVFRNKYLSDLIGFSYARNETRHAVTDFMKHLKDIRTHLHDRTKPHLVTIILDGENCWEYYKRDGRDFLQRLYEAFSKSDEFKTVTVNEYLEMAHPQPTLESLWPGSWIHHNFDIWIGHPEDNSAWDMIAKARHTLVEYQRTHTEPFFREAIADAWEELYIAEGSDWFWWYGDDHHSENDREFDALFRKHLMNIYTLLAHKVPDELHMPIKGYQKEQPVTEPVGFLAPTIDGTVTNYFEWYNAGTYTVGKTGGAMHHVSTMIKAFYYGFDLDTMYVRIDTYEPLHAMQFHALSFAVNFIYPHNYQVVCTYHRDTNTTSAALYHRTVVDGKERLVKQTEIQHAARGTVVEYAIPFSCLPLDEPHRDIEFVITVHKEEIELERWPYQAYVRLKKPTKDMFADMWW